MRPGIFAALVALFIPCASAIAQSSSLARHSGFHAAFGLGYGSASITCSGCVNKRESSVAGVLRLGGAVRPGVVLSGELSGWSKEINGATVTLSWLSLWHAGSR